MPKYPVLDESGKVRQWIAQRKRIAVWENREIGANRPDVLTPEGASCPHWAYSPVPARVLDAQDVEFFHKGPVYFDGHRYHEWSDTPAGWRAARAVKNLPQDNGDAPIRLRFAYTVERVCYMTRETYQYAPEVRKAGDEPMPLGIHYRVAIVQWSARREEE